MSKEEQTMTDSVLGDNMQWSLLPNAKLEVATDGHLQSLGLVVSDDGLPKFKLNEPGPAALASSIFQQNNMVNDESEQSFVVLGQSSLDFIRENSLANYVEISQKSISTDQSSMISSMNSTEIEDNLKKLLEENLKLKETLRQNNTTIKQQFNTITKWQKEVMAVCDNHKQKFLETKELINKLKNENDELREKITKNQSPEISMSSDVTATGYSLENHASSSLMRKSNYHSTENVPALCLNMTSSTVEEDKKSQKDQVVLNGNEQELVKKIDMLSSELSEVKLAHSKLQEIFQELDKRYITDIQLFSMQLQKANKSLEDFKKNSDVSNATELQKLVNKCCEKDNQLTYLKEIITSLEQQIKTLEENAFVSTNVNLEITGERSNDKTQLRDNVEFYNEKVNELNKCFASQCSRYLRIQQFLKESADIVQALENAELFPNSAISADKLKAYKDELCDYRKRLIDEQLQSIDDKLTTIKVQKQFQKIFADYNAIVYELEILRDENSKLETLQAKASEEVLQKIEEMKKTLSEEKKLLEDERTSLLEAQINIQIEKKLIGEERERLQVEQTHLSLDKERLAEEKTSLIEERTSLDRQSKLYEVEESSLQKEKKILQKKCDDLNSEIVKLSQELNIANVTIQQLRANNARVKENEELISVYKIQAEMYQKEFDEMRVTQQNLQEQLQSLSNANIELRTENDRLGGTLSNDDARQPEQRPAAENQQARFCERCRQFLVPGEPHNVSSCIRLMEFD